MRPVADEYSGKLIWMFRLVTRRNLDRGLFLGVTIACLVFMTRYLRIM